MTLPEFTTRIIDRGIEAARRDYAAPGAKSKLDGSIAGFEACRNLSATDLSELLQRASAEAESGRLDLTKEISERWRLICFSDEVEWVCNCASVILVNDGQPPIRDWLPTARAVLAAAEIVGGSSVAGR